VDEQGKSHANWRKEYRSLGETHPSLGNMNQVAAHSGFLPRISRKRRVGTTLARLYM
jgi:hypothetical protein